MSTYFVTRPKPATKSLSLKDILLDLVDDIQLAQMNKPSNPTATRTYKASQISDYMVRTNNIRELRNSLKQFYERYKHLDVFFDPQYNYARQLEIKKQVEKQKLRNGEFLDENIVNIEVQRKLWDEGYKFNPYYYTFYLPKRSGTGFRQIDAPNDELMNALRELKGLLERIMGYNTYHTSAYAYIPNRSRVDLVKKLKANKSRWLLKLDFSNFFGSINIDWTIEQLGKIYPFNMIMGYGCEDIVRNCLKLCFLDGRLPQGTPISPLLTNILMIPIDYEINKKLLEEAQSITEFDKDDGENNYRLIYTRYADDIIIGGHRGFKYKPVIEYIQSVLKEFNAPMVIKPEKTKYGSTAGQNWILGLMYTQDYSITIGHRNKQQIKAMINNFAMDYKNQREIDPSDVLIMMGKISHLKQIEPEYADQLLIKSNAKYGIDVLGTMKLVAYA